MNRAILAAPIAVGIIAMAGCAAHSATTTTTPAAYTVTINPSLSAVPGTPTKLPAPSPTRIRPSWPSPTTVVTPSKQTARTRPSWPQPAPDPTPSKVCR